MEKQTIGGRRNVKHDMHDTKIYRAWRNMCSRTRGHGSTATRKTYAGMPCDFIGDFNGFLAEVGLPASEELELDRIDSFKGYIKGNIRWAPRAVNMANKRNTLWVEYKGTKVRLRALWEQLAPPVAYKTFLYRYKQAWPIEECCAEGKSPIKHRS